MINIKISEDRIWISPTFSFERTVSLDYSRRLAGVLELAAAVAVVAALGVVVVSRVALLLQLLMLWLVLPQLEFAQPLRAHIPGYKGCKFDWDQRKMAVVPV